MTHSVIYLPLVNNFHLSAVAADSAASAAEMAAQRGRAVFELLFCTEIEKQLQVEARWKERKAPIALRLDELHRAADAGTM